MAEVTHTLDLLLDVFDEVGFLGKLLLVDALDRVYLIIWRFEFYLFS